jgi:hypothetical protein
MTADTARCLILVPVARHIERQCEDGLRALEARGHTVRRVYGYSAIDAARNQMASDALRDGYYEMMWIDSDIGFDPDDVERLRSHNLPMTCGAYAAKGQRRIAIAFKDNYATMTFGQGGGLLPITYCGFGFVHVRRAVFDTVQTKHRLPICNTMFGSALVPYFQPMPIPVPGGWWSLSEDYAFCHRVNEAGFAIQCDTTIRLEHWGMYAYQMEDAGSELQRLATYNFRVK